MEESWNFGKIWNDSLGQRINKPIEKRKKIWSSELGGSLVDRWLKMNAEPFSNPFDSRSLRKFEAGNLMEWIVKMVLQRAGILRDSQTWATYQYDGLLPVTGRTDFVAGGKPDWMQSLLRIQSMELPDFFSKATEAIIAYFQANYPDGLTEILQEIKSCSTFMYDRYERTGASPHHQLQLFHCMKALKYEEGHICYISKDDLRILEIGQFLTNQELESKYFEDIKAITHYINANEQPPLELQIVFENGKFSKNWRVEYSNYLTKLYSFDSPATYDSATTPIVQAWNRVMKRKAQGKAMTARNLEIVEAIKKQFPDFEEITKRINPEEIEETEE